MPTAYTHAVQDGTMTEFKDFAMQCARAFGALITMRDDPSDAPIPDGFEPSPWYAERVEQAKADIERLQVMTIDEQIRACNDANKAAYDSWMRHKEKQDATRARYGSMLDKVRGWEPPTADHIELKNFMERQLIESINFDCNYSWPEPTPQKRSEWYEKALARAQKELASAEEENAKEIARCQNRSKWLRDLRQSLCR